VGDWQEPQSPAPSLFFFPAQQQSCGLGARALRGKSIGPGISDFGLRISDFLFFFINPHSAIYNPQFGEAGASGARSIRLDCEPGAPTSD